MMKWYLTYSLPLIEEWVIRRQNLKTLMLGCLHSLLAAPKNVFFLLFRGKPVSRRFHLLLPGALRISRESPGGWSEEGNLGRLQGLQSREDWSALVTGSGIHGRVLALLSVPTSREGIALLITSLPLEFETTRPLNLASEASAAPCCRAPLTWKRGLPRAPGICICPAAVFSCLLYLLFTEDCVNERSARDLDRFAAWFNRAGGRKGYCSKGTRFCFRKTSPTCEYKSVHIKSKTFFFFWLFPLLTYAILQTPENLSLRKHYSISHHFWSAILAPLTRWFLQCFCHVPLGPLLSAPAVTAPSSWGPGGHCLCHLLMTAIKVSYAAHRWYTEPRKGKTQRAGLKTRGESFLSSYKQAFGDPTPWVTWTVPDIHNSRLARVYTLCSKTLLSNW